MANQISTITYMYGRKWATTLSVDGKCSGHTRYIEQTDVGKSHSIPNRRARDQDARHSGLALAKSHDKFRPGLPVSGPVRVISCHILHSQCSQSSMSELAGSSQTFQRRRWFCHNNAELRLLCKLFKE